MEAKSNGADRGKRMASYVRGEGILKVTGDLLADDLDELVAQGAWLLDSDRAEVTLDLDALDPIDSSFIGVLAQLGADARASSKTLVIRASGRAADMLSWAGLHRVVTLHISPAPARV